MRKSGNKAAIIRKALQESVTPEVPASIMQMHAHAIILLDKEAASELATG